ncbi:WD domain, G-beta repeat family protein [Theileria equi strain WA]|uniref:WD domain, G-beta repeat family protein n=1 Tax=Theileria equi strain WA TaxID=1537102 RepID=L0B206_THEEQ|nr:WD domain, G-beta repeat family protein [Theileria equi strain WA]AFZ81523.1 WD domain, G-beta repeat family protein [Theileria equi strain WA]|eukprot:XP_004831189.1 WD domain, G-beta repeat family protein [Theileria equi strain WA]
MTDPAHTINHPHLNLLCNNLYKSLNLFAGEFGSKPYSATDVCTRKHIRSKILDEYLSTSQYTPKTTAKSQIIGQCEDDVPKIKVRKGKSSLAEVIDSVDAELSYKHQSRNKVPYLDVNVSDEVCLKISSKRSLLAISDKTSSTSSDVSLPNTDNLTTYVRETISAGHEIANLDIKPKHGRILRNKPTWHPPWKLHRVLIGHHGWVHCVDVDISNEWFVTGSADRLIKIWDLASCQLKLSLTGHINSVRDVKISDKHPYIFSCAEDNTVKCWDIEQNKVIRSYHGHLSGVYTLALHPALNVLFSGGRDAVVRVWDIRTKQAIHVLSGHTDTIMSIVSQASEPQVISGSQDHTVRLWDLAAGKSFVTLTNHKKGIRSISVHPTEYSFSTCAADNVKVWKCPEGVFHRNLTGHNSILNCSAIKDDGESSILVAGSNNGQLHFWDWASGYKFQTLESTVQRGSLESENGIFACSFDKSESRIITAECDKTIKIWIQDETATPETHPIIWKPEARARYY